eukprot:6458912-Amphidinium_carterae.1
MSVPILVHRLGKWGKLNRLSISFVRRLKHLGLPAGGSLNHFRACWSQRLSLLAVVGCGGHRQQNASLTMLSLCALPSASENLKETETSQKVPTSTIFKALPKAFANASPRDALAK